MKRTIFAILITNLFLAGISIAQTKVLDEENFSATVWFTSDYVFRGASLSSEDPAVQASLDWNYNNFYAGIWGTNLDLTGFDQGPGGPGDTVEAGTSSIEYDLYLGYASSLGAIDYDFSMVYYWYPSDTGNLEADVLEFWLELSHTLATALTPTVGMLVVYSPDATLEDGGYTYIKGLLALALNDSIGVDIAIGSIDVEGDKATPAGYGYTHWETGVTGSVKGFDLDLRYHDTNEQASYVEVWGGTDAIDSRIVFTVSRSF